MKRYTWVATSDDGAFEDESRILFGTKEACYNDMRNAALEKMKWNTNIMEDFQDGTKSIGYEVYFSPNEIIHISYSGKYTYKIVEQPQKKKYTVSLPFSGSLSVDIMAESEDAAIIKAKMEIDDLSKDDIINNIQFGQYDVSEAR